MPLLKTLSIVMNPINCSIKATKVDVEIQCPYCGHVMWTLQQEHTNNGPIGVKHKHYANLTQSLTTQHHKVYDLRCLKITVKLLWSGKSDAPNIIWYDSNVESCFIDRASRKLVLLGSSWVGYLVQQVPQNLIRVVDFHLSDYNVCRGC